MTRRRQPDMTDPAFGTTANDRRPYEDPSVREARRTRELQEASDRILEAGRAHDARKSELARFQPRFSALKTMAWQRLVLDHHGPLRGASAAVRRAALAADPVFQSLPEPARRVWDDAVDGVTERLLEGSGHLAEQQISELASSMASSQGLEAWSPPAIDEDPAALAAMIPRG